MGHWKKILLLLSLVALCFEGVARISPWIIGKQVHQKYLIQRGPATEEAYGAEASTTQWVWKTNGRGARGEVYRGQSRQLGVFGTSTSACSLLTQTDTWPSRLSALWPDLHVDNFSRDGVGSFEVRGVMDDLAQRHYRFDVAIVMTRPSLPPELHGRQDLRAFHFWKRWARRWGLLQFPGLLWRQLELEWQRSGLEVPAAWAEDFDPRSLQNRQRIAAGQVKFADDPEDFQVDAAHLSHVRREARALIEAAREVSANVFYVTEPVAFDEREIEGVAERWYLLDPIPGKPGFFRSRRSGAFLRRVRVQAMAQVAQEMGVQVIDLDSYMRVQIRSRADLFLDHNHFTATGAALAADHIAGHLHAVLGEGEGGR